jgi:hypothetical protein
VRFDTGTASMPVVAVAMRVGSGWQFALNALTFVSELVSEVGRPTRSRVVRVRDFSVVEASCRESLVRVRMWSRRPVERASCESERSRGISFTVSACPIFVGRAFGMVLFFLIVDCRYPLFWYPTYRLMKKYILRKVRAYVYVVEFQKRGLPHAHFC